MPPSLLGWYSFLNLQEFHGICSLSCALPGTRTDASNTKPNHEPDPLWNFTYFSDLSISEVPMLPGRCQPTTGHRYLINQLKSSDFFGRSKQLLLNKPIGWHTRQAALDPVRKAFGDQYFQTFFLLNLNLKIKIKLSISFTCPPLVGQNLGALYLSQINLWKKKNLWTKYLLNCYPTFPHQTKKG